MKAVLSVALTLAFAGIAVGETFQEKFLSSYEKGLSCHAGFKGIPLRLTEAAEACSHKNVVSYTCFVICVNTEAEHITPRDPENQLDSGMGDLLAMESFDMDSRAGRESYWKVAHQRQVCGTQYMDVGRKFPGKFDDAKACEAMEDYFHCACRNSCPKKE